MQVCGVHPSHVGMLWPQIRDFVLSAMRLGYDEFYGRGRYQAGLYRRRDAALGGVRRHGHRGGDRLAHRALSQARGLPVPLIGGRRMATWLPAMQAMIESYARAKRLHAHGRGRTARLVPSAGYRNIGPVLMKELEP